MHAVQAITCNLLFPLPHLPLPPAALCAHTTAPSPALPHLRAVSGSRCSRRCTSTAGSLGGTKEESRLAGGRFQRLQSSSWVGSEHDSTSRCSARIWGQKGKGARTVCSCVFL